MSETDEAMIDDLRQRGNHEFSQQNYDTAVSLYSAALEAAQGLESPNARIVNLCNRSACYYLMEEYLEAKQDALEAWNLSSNTSIKAAYRLAKTQLALKEYEQAKKTIQTALAVIEQTDESEQIQQQQQSLQDLWKQTLAAALEKPPKPETSIRYIQRNVSIKEFIKGKELGYGNFSEIIVVTHKETKEQFALKIIEKKKAADLAKRQHPNVYNEIQMERRALLERLPAHPFIVRMYHAFQDYNNLYYLMDLHTSWNDLWSELRYNGKMVGCHRSQAQVWLYQLLDAMEHMHRHGIVHRDLKPENVLLTHQGHVLVIDFGTAKDLLQPDLNGPEFVGTPDFMSPEAVNGTSGMEEAKEAVKRGEVGAVHTADLYTFGAITFILQTGHTPYWSPSPYLAFLKIKRGNLRRPQGIVDDEAWDLIQKLMQLEPEKRLGADVFALVEENGQRRIEKKMPGGYDVIREHPYFDSVRQDERAMERTPIPSLRDLCYRAVAELAHKDSHDLDICDKHPPGDGSSHDMMRLSPRDRAAVMHVLDRLKLLREPRVYARFFADPAASRLDKIRPATRDFVGQTQMNDDQGKPPKAQMNDPYATPVAVDDIEFVHLSNPLLVQHLNETCDEDTRKQWIKLFKKCISNINRARPKMVIASGYIDAKCRKLLARISDSIPVVVHDGSTFFTFWMMGVQCIALQSSQVSEESEQVIWLRELLEQVRMSKHPVFVFCDDDPRELPKRILKRLARGRTLCLMGPSKDEAFTTEIDYEANEKIDDASIRSTDSEEDDKDEFTMRMEGTKENGLRWIYVDEEPDKWDTKFKRIDLE